MQVFTKPWASSCGLKKAYGSQEDALDKAKWLVGNGLSDILYSYKCSHCKMFHLGHKEEKIEIGEGISYGF